MEMEIEAYKTAAPSLIRFNRRNTFGEKKGKGQPKKAKKNGLTSKMNQLELTMKELNFMNRCNKECLQNFLDADIHIN